MRWIKFILILLSLCLISTHVLAEESRSGGLMSILQRLGMNTDQAEQELLPPDEAFKLSLEVRDDHTLVAHLTPAKDYYLYRDKIAFESKSEGIHIEQVTLPSGKMKDDQLFGKTEVYYQPLEAVITLRRDKPVPEQLSLSASYQGCNEPIGVCYAPINKEKELLLPVLKAMVSTAADVISSSAQAASTNPTAELFQVPGDAPLFETESYKIERLFASGNFWLILSGFFGIGLLLAFTPCVFPMFPILSGIIASKGQQMSKLRGFMLALAYVLGMSITYAIAGAAAGLSGAMLSAALQNAWVLGTFALVFTALAFSMFGFYELRLPASIQNKLVEETGHFRGGQFAGVFGMGALSALIVSPCVAAPLAGALIYISQTRDVILGGSALFVMALGMGVPLLLLGVSAGALLPRSGAWMKSIQQFFGVLLLAVAIWLISPVITEVTHMLLWAALLIISAIYLHALDPLPNQAPGFSKFLKGVGVIALLTGIALLIGVLSGSRDVLQPLSRFNLAAMPLSAQLTESPASTNNLLPFKQVKTVAELDELIRKSRGRYVMIDFYADWCVSCKEMERFTFTDPHVQERLKNVELVQINVTEGTPDDTALLKRFKLFGPPGILFFDSQGVEIPNIKIIGYLDKKDFVTVLDAILL
ncbi:protein-disulfide reductase DsbD [Nitrosomonas sp. HPC101]|uniref:protein-disulfide reductase DsbD n=1 Tax=Nitrosomonas sp. HPC101 TaxID=1658667 RepID=UPI00136ADA4B|nr:protein-disulfide reductase DsbD [Nitrosomonas sp. HPC101]MXS85233.1 protein-disulfide reductase DsbD [Nitrosomonas sp. HPC101]